MARLLSPRAWLPLMGVVVLTAGTSTEGLGQSLREVDAHLREGRLQDARVALLEWEVANPDPGRADQQRALWLRGLLTLDPDEASSSYARLIVEYPGGPFTDRALLRLAQAADLRGNASEAAVHYAQLARDHPTSPLRAQAVRWLRDHPEVTAQGSGPRGGAGQGGQDRRAQSPPTGTTRAPGSSANPDGGSTGVGAESVGYTVQLGAFSDRRWADDLAGRLQEAGFEPRVVRLRNDDLLRVRIGRYRTRAEAVVVRDEARAAGFEASLSTDARQETSVG